MQYHNPFRLFRLEPKTVDAERIRELQQNIDTEFAAFSLYESINYYGSKLTLQELRRALRELQDVETRTFHEKLLEQPELLNFLEYGHLSYLHNRVQYAEDPLLMEFVAPYFAHQYNEALLQALKVQDKETISLLSGQKLPLFEDFDNMYYHDAAQYLDGTLRNLQTLREDPRLYIMSERELAMQLPDKTIEVYNMLPEYFDDARDMIGNQMRIIAQVFVMEAGRQDGAVAIINQALKLKLSEKLRKELTSYKKQLNPGFGRIPLFVTIGIGVVLLLFLLKWMENNLF